MEYIPPARRDVLKAAAASGVLLGTSIGASGTAAAQNDDHPNYLLVFGDGTVTEYEFSVSGANSVEKTTDPGETSIDPELVTINTSDAIESTTYSPTGRPVTVVSGRTTNQADAYHFAGDPSGISFRADQDNVVVFLNSEQRNPQFVGYDAWFGDFVLFFGDGTPGTYEFTATGRVEKVTYPMGAPVDPDDVTLNNTDTVTHDDGTWTVSGRTTNQADAYTLNGEISSIKADPSVLVYFPTIPSIAVRQTGCVEDSPYGTVGVVSLTNHSDQWVFVSAWGTPTDGDTYFPVPPKETGSYWSVPGTHRISAAPIPYPEYTAIWGDGALINGRIGTNTVTVTAC